jgi:hypothetical protein
MDTVLRKDGAGSVAIPQADLRFLRIMLGLQVALGLLWGVSMLIFARQIVLGAPDGPPYREDRHGGRSAPDAGLGAILVWRAPQRARDVLLLMIF